MTGPKLTARQWVGWIGFALVFLLTAAVAVWRGDILRAGLDPQVPFQTYQPPPAPDYARPAAWALNEVRVPDAGPAAVFFVHSTTYDGGAEGTDRSATPSPTPIWNGWCCRTTPGRSRGWARSARRDTGKAVCTPG